MCRHPSGYSIGFGECTGNVLPAGSAAPPLPMPPARVALRDVSLASYWRSSCSWRVRVALAYHQVPFTYVAVNLLENEQQDVSGMAQVPRLDWSDASGTRHTLTQSLAIIELIDEAGMSALPTAGRPSLLPTSPVTRARAREIAEIINSGTQPLQNLNHIKAIKGVSEGVDGRAIGGAAIVKGLASAERLAAANHDARFCVGSHTSIADLCVVPQLNNARRFDVDLTPYPRLRAVEEHSLTLPFFRAAHPEVQPDAKKSV